LGLEEITKMRINKTLTMPIGLILLAISLIMNKFLPSNPLFDFIEGFMMGLSIVLNIVYIIAISRKNGTK